jgi:hypothetical protein
MLKPEPENPAQVDGSGRPWRGTTVWTKRKNQDRIRLRRPLPVDWTGASAKKPGENRAVK